MKNTVGLIVLALVLSSCAIKGSIDKTTTTTNPDGSIVVEQCSADYINSTWGTSTGRTLSGCGVEGGVEESDNTQDLSVPLELVQKLLLVQ